MADSTNGKNKKTLDAFADDLDAMLNIGDSQDVRKVGLIEDDDAIDRLLMGDNFQHAEDEPERDEFADIDALIGDDLDGHRKMAGEIDEFGDDIDDMIANVQIHPQRQTDPAVDEVDDFADLSDETELVKNIDEVITPELTALESVADIDEFADQGPETVQIPGVFVAQQEEIEGMTEIDEFSDMPSAAGHSADFLMADFDISSDDDTFNKPVQTEPLLDDFADDADMPTIQPVAAKLDGQSTVAPLPQSVDDEVDEFELAEPDAAAFVAPPPLPVEKTASPVDHSAELAALATQITVLKKQQQVFKQEMTEKAGKVEVLKCLDDLDSLQTEQKKAKRAVDAVSNQKPVAAYVASGLAVTALLIGTGLGFQGFVAKSQVGELVQIVGKLQEQVKLAPTSDAADKEMLRKQLDELTVASSVAATQIAEINKALQGDSGSAKVGGDLGKQLAELSNQNMQMGASIEALQTKVSALEKGRTAIAVAPKPEKKKPEVVAENWAVNLIAFKQDWYAKRKAEEFATKGVPAKVSKTESKGENWYRLSVDGFKSQYEAAGYAAKVKKTLNLDSVWVTRNKD